MHDRSVNGGCGWAAISWSGSSGSEIGTGSSAVTPDIARNMHLTTGPEPSEPNPAFSRYDTTVHGLVVSWLNAANTDESFHGNEKRPWAVPVFPAIGGDAGSLQLTLK